MNLRADALTVFTQMTTEHWLNPALPVSIPPSTLARAGALVTKTAFLAGMLAPETAACLSRLLMDSDAHYSRIIDGEYTEPEVLMDALSLVNKQSTQGEITDLRRRIVAALAHHYHVLQTQPLLHGNGDVARMIVRQHLAQLGLHPHLWSISRGLARRKDEYHTALAIANRPRASELSDGIPPSDKASLTFIELMLDVCHEEIGYMTDALSRRRLRECVLHAFITNSRLQEAGIRPETAPAFLALLIQGALPRAEFKTFTGRQPETAGDQLSRLIRLGMVVISPSNFRMLKVGLPVWFAEDILPDLHKHGQR
jgi:Fic family protein